MLLMKGHANRTVRSPLEAVNHLPFSVYCGPLLSERVASCPALKELPSGKLLSIPPGWPDTPLRQCRTGNLFWGYLERFLSSVIILYPNRGN